MNNTIRLEQIKLWCNGCYNGAIDGIAGPITRAGREKYAALACPIDTTPPEGLIPLPSSYWLDKLGNPRLRTTQAGLVTIQCKPLVGVSVGNMKSAGCCIVHKCSAEAMAAVMADIEAVGLSDKIITYDGTYSIRCISGSVSYSLHSWAVAIDLNADWNARGSKPAQRGSKGSLVELVPIFHKHGFYWGGNFTKQDGMHFEYARRI